MATRLGSRPVKTVEEFHCLQLPAGHDFNGEAAGADLRMLTMLQFLRIIIVVTAMPIGFSIWHGAPVGSAAGLSPGVGGAAGLTGIAMVLGVASIGVVLGLRLRIPAGQLIAPMLLAGALGWGAGAHLAPPGWLMELCPKVGDAVIRRHVFPA